MGSASPPWSGGTEDHRAAWRLFAVFSVAHLVGWALVPALVRFQLPRDALEASVWARHLDGGYDRDPYLVAVAVALVEHLANGSDAGLYLAGSLAVAITLLLAFELARRILPPAHALASVFLLLPLEAFTFGAVDFNDNVLSMPLWAGAILCFRDASASGRRVSLWLAGLLCGLAVVTKYTAFLLPFSFLLFLVRTGKTALMRSAGFWASAATFVLLVAPHAAWLWRHDLVTVRYTLDQLDLDPGWTYRVRPPAEFLLVVVAVLLCPALLLGIGRWLARSDARSLPPVLAPADRTFLRIVSAGPFVGVVLVALLTAAEMRTAWLQPTLSGLGLLLVASLRPRLGPQGTVSLTVFVLVLDGLMLGGYAIAILRAGTTSQANFPATRAAAELQSEWRRRHSTGLAFVAGPRSLAASLARYASDRPDVYFEWSPSASPWIEEEALRGSGGLFVWRPRDDEARLVEELRRRFPRLGPAEDWRFAWMRGESLAPAVIRVAFLAPDRTRPGPSPSMGATRGTRASPRSAGAPSATSP